MSKRRFVLVDFTHMNRAGYLRLYEAGRSYALPSTITHAAPAQLRISLIVHNRLELKWIVVDAALNRNSSTCRS